MKRPILAEPKFDYVPFKGGYDTEARAWNATPGKLRESQNYEVSVNNEGYVDIQGYEAFDGQAAPSAATYSILDVNITGSFSPQDTIIQLVTGATAVVVAVVTTTTPNYLAVTKITGIFDDTNDLQVSAVTEGSSLSVTKRSGATDPLLHATYLNLAADVYRALILPVPGSGSVLGIYMLNDVWYAWRNNVGGTEAEMYRSSATGWVAVPLGFELSFTSGGTYEISEGDTITGATSTETAVVTRVVLESGSFAGGDAAGRLVMASQSGAFVAENLDVGANPNVATIAGDATAITMQPGGRFEFVRENFGGQAGTLRLYGCDGVNRGFEFDGTVFVPIATGTPTDTPTHVIVHKQHLFFSFASSVQHSGIGRPYIFDPIFGAGELALGDIVTGFMSEPGSEGNATLSIYTRNTTHMLYGASSLDWNLVRFRAELGALPHTIQQFGQTIYMDDRGITTLRTTQSFGNFQQATVSGHIQSYINLKRTITSASCVARDKNQYRIFFSDNTGLYVTTTGTKIAGMMPVRFSDPVLCVASLEKSDGQEVMMFGSSNGNVYQLDKGTSFNGGNIDAYMKLHYTFNKSIRWLKSYKGITLEAQGEGYSEFSLATEIGYNDIANIPQPLSQTETLDFSVPVWDVFVWDSFIWDGATLGPANLKLEGSAENISLVIRKNSDKFPPISLAGAMIRYIFRRQLR
jgi:hypothetical protein